MKKNTYVTLLKNRDPDAIVYTIGIVVAIIISATLIFLNRLISDIPCLFKSISGLYCPGCGGTRAFWYLFHGNIFQSFLYHPFVIYFVCVFLIFYVSQTLRFITSEQIKGFRLKSIYIYTGLGIIILNFIIKNFLLLFNIELLG